MRTTRVAIFGAGFWAQFQIAAWRELPGVEIVALANRTVGKAEALAARFDIPRVYGDPAELLRRERPDVADIVTEIPAHEPLVLLAAEHRTPVICQKPMGPDLDACERMVAACRAAGVPFFVHENFRWQAPMRAVKRALDDGRIGRPYRALIRLSHGTMAMVENQPALFEMERWALMDMGSHALDLARFFFGEPDWLACQTRKTIARARGEDIASVMLKLGEVIGVCELGWADDPVVFVEGTGGTLALHPDDTLTVTTTGVATEQVVSPSYAWADPAYGACHPSIVACHANLLAALRGEGAAETTAEDNLRTMRLVFAAYDSAASAGRDEVIRLA
jgi:predicted dehydrogenase